MAAAAGSTAARVDTIISSLSLLSHPEGGYYARFYTSPTTLSTPRGPRSCTTCINYLLPFGQVSRFHTLLQQDEIWCHHSGDALEVIELSAAAADSSPLDAVVKRTRIGPGGVPTHVVHAGTVFGARCLPGPSGFALVSCAVSPGFDFADFDMFSRDELTARFQGPAAALAIAELTCEQPSA